MILVVGSSSDKVYPKLVRCLRNRNYQFVTIDEDFSGSYHVCHEIGNSEATFRIIGRDCEGNRDIGSIFVRHAVARTLNPAALQVMGMLQTNLNHIFYSVSCPIINLPSNAYSNYSKPYQVGILARASFKVPKTLVTNLPEEVCVEVPVFVDKAGFHPVHVGALPPQCVALNHISVMVEEMAVEASLTGDPTMVYHSIAYDPLTAAVLSLAEIKEMVNEMLQQNRDYLPQFKHFSV